MANNYIEIMKLVNAGNKMGLSNTITRDNGMPLDLSSVQESYEAAVIYAATKAIAFVGQPISVGDTLYIISDTPAQEKFTAEDGTEYDNYLKRVGIIPTGDEASISVTSDGLISLFGFSAAENGKLPMKIDGSIRWKSLEEIGAGDGNDDTTYTFALNDDKDGIIVTPLFNGQPIMEGEEGAQTQKKFELIFDVYTQAEADAKFLAKADYTPYDDTTLAGRVKAIEDDYLKTEDKYDDTALAARVKAIEDDYLVEADKYDDTALAGRVTTIEEVVGNAEGGLVKDVADNKTAIGKALTDSKDYTDAEIDGLKVTIEKIEEVDHIVLKDKDGNTIASANASTFVQDSFLDDVVYESESGKIKFTWTMGDGSTKTDEVAVADFVQTYTAGNGLKLTGNEFAIDDTIVATVNALNGVNTTAQKGVDDAAAAQKTIDDYVADHEDDYDNNAIDSAISGAIDALGIADYAKSADVVDNDTFEQFKTDNTSAIETAANTARTNAVADVEAKGYAVATEVEADLAEKVDGGSIVHTSEGVEEGVERDGTTLNIVIDAYKKSETYTKEEVNTAITTKIGESEADVLASLTDYKKANDAEVYGSEKVAAWTDSEGNYTPVYTQDSRIDTLETNVATAQSTANQGVADAKTANDAITALTTGAVATNTSDINTIKGRLDTAESTIGTHSTEIAALIGTVGHAAGEGTDASGLVKAVSDNASAIGTINGTIANLDSAYKQKDSELAALIAGNTTKFNDYSTTEQMNAAIDAKIEAIPEVDLSDYAKSADVAATYAKAADVYTKTEADAAFMTETEVDNRINALINAADPEGGKTITDIQNLVKYVDENAGEITALVTATDANTAKLAGVTTTVVDAINAAVNELDTSDFVKASDEVTVADDGTLGIGTININKITQTSGDILILDGGRATASAS